MVSENFESVNFWQQKYTSSNSSVLEPGIEPETAELIQFSCLRLDSTELQFEPDYYTEELRKLVSNWKSNKSYKKNIISPRDLEYKTSKNQVALTDSKTLKTLVGVLKKRTVSY